MAQVPVQVLVQVLEMMGVGKRCVELRTNLRIFELFEFEDDSNRIESCF